MRIAISVGKITPCHEIPLADNVGLEAAVKSGRKGGTNEETIIRIGARKVIYEYRCRARYEKRHDRTTARGTNEGQFTRR